jgi:hypothetical protein
VIDALGFNAEPPPAPTQEGTNLAAMSSEQRQLILDELSAGRLTSAEALALLQGQDLPPKPATDESAG